jgi:ankyrin repeat protein
VLVQNRIGQQLLQLPLLHSMAFTSAHPHGELAESVRLLVAAGADINTKGAVIGGDQWTALMCAAPKTCCTQDVLLRAGADPCVRSSPGGSTALQIAAEVGLAESCKSERYCVGGER